MAQRYMQSYFKIRQEDEYFERCISIEAFLLLISIETENTAWELLNLLYLHISLQRHAVFGETIFNKVISLSTFLP